jgi:hypothetical protein
VEVHFGEFDCATETRKSLFDTKVRRKFPNHQSAFAKSFSPENRARGLFYLLFLGNDESELRVNIRLETQTD